jgi:hypothetical protein
LVQFKPMRAKCKDSSKNDNLILCLVMSFCITLEFDVDFLSVAICFFCEACVKWINICMHIMCNNDKSLRIPFPVQVAEL